MPYKPPEITRFLPRRLQFSSNPFASRRNNLKFLFLGLMSTPFVAAAEERAFGTHYVWYLVGFGSILLNLLREHWLIRCPRCGKALSRYKGLNWDIAKKNRDTCHACGFTEAEFLAQESQSAPVTKGTR